MALGLSSSSLGVSGQFPGDCLVFLSHVVVPPPHESMDNGPSLFDYGLDNPYNDLIDDFDQYLEYGKRYQNSMSFKDAFYG